MTTRHFAGPTAGPPPIAANPTGVKPPPKAALTLAIVAACILGCAAPIGRTSSIALGPAVDPYHAFELAAEALERHGYFIALRDPVSLALATDWRYDRGLLSLSRHRILIRMSQNPPAILLSAPGQTKRGDSFLPDGEDAEAREHAVASVLSRIQQG